MTDHLKTLRDLVAEVERRKVCTHPKRTPSRAAGSYYHDKGPVEFCDTCNATCYWGKPIPVDDSHLEVDVAGDALSALLAERDAMRAVVEAAKAASVACKLACDAKGADKAVDGWYQAQAALDAALRDLSPEVEDGE